MKQLIGQQIGQYQIEALLGEGGMGAVYRAHDLKQDRMVAFKIMQANLTHKPPFRNRFMQEAEAIAHFSSPAIVTVLDTGTHEEAPFIVMEYIEGGSLINYMRQLDWSGAKPTIETIITIAAQVAEGLSYAHQRGLIHRDIKPGNILLKMREGAYIPRQAIITDFGLAIQRKDGDEMDTAPFMGSLAYMSPEQCENKPLDGRSDIYALGILLYQLETGQLPFKINAPADIVKHLEEDPLPPGLINPDLPEILETITLKAMAKKPGDRYQSAAEMAHALRQALANPALQTAVLAQASNGSVTQWLDNKWVAAIDVEDRVDIHQTWTTLGKCRLFIVHQYEESQIVGLEKDEISLGREASNDIVLTDQSVSGQHLRLVRTPQGWSVSDVGSTNHSYLGERMLEYEQVYNWPSDEPLRVGPYFLRWQPFEEQKPDHHVVPVLAGAALASATLANEALLQPEPEPADTDASVTDALPLAVYSDGEVLGIAINPPTLELDPSVQNLLDISITNRDVTVKDITLRLEVDGRPPMWATLTDYQMKLMPDETNSTTALIDLTQAPDILAGTHILKLIAITDKGEVEHNEVAVVINSQEEFSLDMHPSNLQEKVTCRLTISDNSNFQNDYTVMGIDDSDALIFDFDEPQNAILANFDEAQQNLKIAPRQEAWLGFRVRPRKRPLFGANETLPFKIRVRTPNTEWQSLIGQVEISARITRRILLLFLLVILLICGTGYLAFYRYNTVQAERYAELQGQLEDAETRAENARAEMEAIDAQLASEDLTDEEKAALEAAKAEAEAELNAAAAEAAALGEEVDPLAEEDTVDETAEEDAIAAAAVAEEEAAEEEASAAVEAEEEATSTPEPNNPPTGIEFSATTITENSAIGSVVGEFSAVDPDVAQVVNRFRLSRRAQQGDEFSFSLVSGSGDTNNDYFAINGNELITAVDINFEETGTLSFRVAVEDAAGDSYEESFSLTVIDTDDMPYLSITSITVSEDADTAELTVAVTGDNYDTASVEFATTDGTAVAGTDYTTTSGTLTWEKDNTDDQIIEIPILDNAFDQADRTFVVTLANAENAIISNGSADITITDDDVEPTLSIADITISESITDGKATITVELEGASGEEVTVDYETFDNTATAGATEDYVATKGSLSWAAEATGTLTFDITINTDDIDEADESFTIILSNAVNATISDNEATVIITDNNDAPKITIGDVSVTEGDTQITIPVTMTGKSSSEAWVEYATSNGSNSSAATADYPDPDFESTSDRITWAAETEGMQAITIQINDDDIDEVDEEFFVVSLYDNSTTTSIQDASGNIYIQDDDDEPIISLENIESSPVSEGTSSKEATVTINGRSSRAITVYYSTQNDTATKDEDYTPVTNGSLTWEALETNSQTIRLGILDDETDEDAEEIFILALDSADNAQVSSTNQQTNVIIQDDDPTPIVSVNDSAIDVDENDATEQVSLLVNIDRPSTQTITVTYTTVDGTAVSGSDFTEKTRTLTWNPGTEDQRTVTIDINNDDIFENDETFTFRLDSVSTNSAVIGDSETAVTILNDDPTPIISIDNVSPALSDIKEETPLITVTLVSDRQSSSEFEVEWSTEENTGAATDSQASAGIDYTSGGGTAVWPANSAAGTTQSFAITLQDDNIDELDESFLLNLTSTTVDVADADATTTLTILDNDLAPTLSITDLSENEGDFSVSVPVTMTGGSYQEITLPYTITNGTAINGNDYDVTNATGILTWTANSTNDIQTISLDILEDEYDDDDETININLGTATPPDAATIPDLAITLTIIDDDLPPALAIGDASITETDSGTVTALVPVTLTGVSETETTVQYFTDDNAAGTTAVAGTDYTAIPQNQNTILTWAANETGTKTFDLTIIGDEIDEGTAETIQVGLSDATAGIDVTLPNTSTVTIEDDDDQPVIEIGSATIPEGDTGSRTVTLPITMTGTSAWPITVNYDTLENTADAADFETISGDSITWVAGTSGTQTIDVIINNDTVHEGDEDFYVDISTSDSDIADINIPRATITIEDNETEPKLAISGATVTEGADSTTTSATITVTINGTSQNDISVRYHTSDDTATTSNNDYEAINNSASYTLTWSTGDTADKTFTVTINGDDVDESSSEQFFVNLSNESNATITTDQATVTITDDDDAPSLSVGIPALSFPEGNAGSITVDVPVSISGSSDQEITVNYYTSDNTALSSSDYDAIANDGTNILTWPAYSEADQEITITINGDTLDEADESFYVHIITPTNATINSAQGIVTILDDDSEPSLSISGVTVTEGDAGSVNGLVTVSISGTSADTVTVDYATADNTATSADNDYVAISTQTLSWASGDTSDKTFSVMITGDTKDEGSSENFYVNLSGATNASLSSSQATITITDDDDPPTLSFGSASITEGDSGSKTVTIPVSISGTSSETVTVEYYTSDDTATVADGDYDAISNTTLTWVSGDTADKSFTVTINGDEVDEGSSEQFYIHLDNEANATLTSNQASVTITDDDTAGITTTPTSLTLDEAPTGNYTGTYTITLNTMPTSGVQIDLAIAASTSGECTIHSPAGGQVDLTTSNWSTGVPVTITTSSDADVEGTHACNITQTVANNQSADEYDNLAISDFVVTILE